jgi:hypothetical protein
MKRLALLLLLSLSLSAPAFAWGEKGHYIVNEAATMSLPTDMPHFFYEAFPDLIWLGPEPDRWKGTGSSLDAANPPDHFLDYEHVEGLDLPPSRYDYIDLMYSSGRLRQRGLKNDEAGFLPWRIAEVAQKLQVAFREWRSSRPGSLEREIIERDAIHFAGILGHYVADSSNPQHATINYNGWVEANPNGYAIDCGTHSRFETTFVSHSIEVSDVAPKVLPTPTLRTDYFATALEAVRASQKLVEPLYQIDKRDGFKAMGAPPREGFEFATDRLAAGAGLLRDLWWSAWVNSAEERRRR